MDLIHGCRSQCDWRVQPLADCDRGLLGSLFLLVLGVCRHVFWLLSGLSGLEAESD